MEKGLFFGRNAPAQSPLVVGLKLTYPCFPPHFIDSLVSSTVCGTSSLRRLFFLTLACRVPDFADETNPAHFWMNRQIIIDSLTDLLVPARCQD